MPRRSALALIAALALVGDAGAKDRSHVAGRAKANGIDIAYESFGPTRAPAIVMIQGLGVQLVTWPSALIDDLVRRGYRVIVFDNRDVGLSTKFDAAGPPDLAAVFAAMAPGAKPPKLAYTLDDMARDTVGLMDALNIRKAHVVGASMGGQIAQLVAIHHPDRVLSLTSIMTDTGNPGRTFASPELMQRMPPAPPPGAGVEAVVAYALASAKVLGGPAYPVDEARVRAEAERDFRRSYYPAGGGRHLAAGLLAGDRREGLRRLRIPTVVLHGEADPLIPVSNAREQAAMVPGAELDIIPGMGHEQPPAASPLFAAAIAKAAARGAR